jgi:hypothetical protein
VPKRPVYVANPATTAQRRNGDIDRPREATCAAVTASVTRKIAYILDHCRRTKERKWRVFHPCDSVDQAQEMISFTEQVIG